MAALNFDQLEAEVTRDADVNSSASTLISRLADEIEAGKNDPVRLQGLVDRLRAQQDALAAAVAAVPTSESSSPSPSEPV